MGVVAASVKMARSGLGKGDKPIGSFLFSGPTGVGKTEAAKQLAYIMGIELIRFDMSEYMERHAVSRLIGAPPGYVGFDQGGLLTEAVTKKPHAVLLLDEIEKLSGKWYTPTLPVAASSGDRDQDKVDLAFRVSAEHIKHLSSLLDTINGALKRTRGKRVWVCH